jgi:hypothetical protein
MSQPPPPTGLPTHPLAQPQPLPPPINRPLRPKKFGWPAMIIAVVWSFGTGAAVMALGSTATTGTPAATTTVTKRVANDEPTGTEPAEFAPKKSDFEIGIKILEKTCFGSGGCSIGYRIKPKYVSTQDLPDEGTLEVTYRVTGDDSGPRQNTFKMVGGQPVFDKEEFAATSSSSTVLKAKVIEVSYTED